VLVSKYVNQSSEQVSKKWGEPVREWEGKRKISPSKEQNLPKQ